MISAQLLDLAFQARLRRVFHENLRARENVSREFGLAWAIAPDSVEVGSGADHVVGKIRRPSFCPP